MINFEKIKYQMIGVFFLITFFLPKEEDSLIKKALYVIIILMFLFDIIKHIIDYIQKKQNRPNR